MVSENAFYRQPELKLYVRDVSDKLGKKRSFVLRSWATIKDAKDAIQRILHIPVHAQRLYFGPLLTSGGELPNHRTLPDAGIHRSGETLLLEIKRNTDFSFSSDGASNGNNVYISSSMIDSTPKSLRTIVQRARQGVMVGIKPELSMDGSGGTYFLHDSRKNKVAVFKPADEEPYSDNNPRGYLPQAGQSLSLREGIAPGEGCIREVAAFLLDHEGFADVPMTTLVEVNHPAFNTNGSHLRVAQGGASIGSHSISPTKTINPKKVGSMQEFVTCEDTMDDLSPSKISVDDVHKIAILDIRILNADRNAANLLVRRRSDNSLQLVPIDHSFCLRASCDVSWMDWCWLDWPQLKKPLSKHTEEYIRNLDIEADARILKERLNINDEAIDYFRASSTILKAGVEAGLSLYQIATLCCRNDDLAEEPSLLERLTDMADELANQVVGNDVWHHSTASRALVEQLTPQRGGVSPVASSKGRFYRSVSSAEFRSLGSQSRELERGVEEAIMGNRTESPEMAQSSGSSDSGSDAPSEVLPDRDEIDEWAHNIIEDSFVSFHSVTPARRSTRSSSICSDDASSDSLTSSPKGFWRVDPCATPPPPDILSDDGSFTWSPLIPAEKTCDFDDEIPPLSLDFPAPGERRRSVQFAQDLPKKTGGTFLLPPAMMQDGSRDTSLGSLSLARQESNGMTRSKSYSALTRSASLVSSTSSSGMRDDVMGDSAFGGVPGSSASAKRGRKDEEHIRNYFHKFIDLVITREMHRVSSMERHAAVYSS